MQYGMYDLICIDLIYIYISLPVGAGRTIFHWPPFLDFQKTVVLAADIYFSFC